MKQSWLFGCNNFSVLSLPLLRCASFSEFLQIVRRRSLVKVCVQTFYIDFWMHIVIVKHKR